jgi:hypothetical protein
MSLPHDLNVPHDLGADHATIIERFHRAFPTIEDARGVTDLLIYAIEGPDQFPDATHGSYEHHLEGLLNLLAYADEPTMMQVLCGSKDDMAMAIRKVAKERAIVTIACFALYCEPHDWPYAKLVASGQEMAGLCKDLWALSDATRHLLMAAVEDHEQLVRKALAVIEQTNLSCNPQLRELRDELGRDHDAALAAIHQKMNQRYKTLKPGGQQ